MEDDYSYYNTYFMILTAITTSNSEGKIIVEAGLRSLHCLSPYALTNCQCHFLESEFIFCLRLNYIN